MTSLGTTRRPSRKGRGTWCGRRLPLCGQGGRQVEVGGRPHCAQEALTEERSGRRVGVSAATATYVNSQVGDLGGEAPGAPCKACVHRELGAFARAQGFEMNAAVLRMWGKGCSASQNRAHTRPGWCPAGRGLVGPRLHLQAWLPCPCPALPWLQREKWTVQESHCHQALFLRARVWVGAGQDKSRVLWSLPGHTWLHLALGRGPRGHVH